MIHVIADLHIKPGQRDQFIKVFNQLVPEVLAEDGCIAYGPTVDTPAGHEAQPPINDNLVTVVEQWESVETLAAHSAAPHMAAFFEAHGHLLENAIVRVTKPV